MKRIKDGSFVPYVFHMCWTANKKQKLSFFKDVDLWFLPESCTVPKLVSNPDQENLVKQCFSPL